MVGQILVDGKLASTVSTASSTRARLVIAVVALALVGAGAWLFMQTRPSAPPREPPSVAASPAAPPRPVTPTPPPTAPPPAVSADAGAPAAGQIDVVARDAARAQRTEWVERMASHAGREKKWADKCESLLDEIGSRAEREADRGSYIAGCTATYTFTSRRVYDELARDVVGWTTYTAWTGGKQWSSPEYQDDGRVIVALLLYRPD